MKSAIFFTALLSVAPSLVFASDDWRSKVIETEGMKIVLSYKTETFSGGEYKMGRTTTYARPLFINVYTDAHYRSGGSGGLWVTDRVRAVLSNFCAFRGYNMPAEVTNHSYDLQYDVNTAHYYAEVPFGLPIHSSEYAGTKDCWQEIAVVKEGTWYKNGAENFKFSLY